MYDENDVEIPSQTAGLLLAAILSDTLAFRSPTCTAVDVNAANRLAGIAGVDIAEFANEMFVISPSLRYPRLEKRSACSGWRFAMYRLKDGADLSSPPFASTGMISVPFCRRKSISPVLSE